MFEKYIDNFSEKVVHYPKKGKKEKEKDENNKINK